VREEEQDLAMTLLYDLAPFLFKSSPGSN